MRNWSFQVFSGLFAVAAIVSGVHAAPPSTAETAQAIDAAINRELKNAGMSTAPVTNDEDFLRRVSLDVAGTLPTPRQVTLFGLDPDPQKREKLIARLLASDDYAENWMRYWRDVIFNRATNMRVLISRNTFQDWMKEQLASNASWDEVATQLITATGDVRENGATTLVFAQDGDASEIASEVSRIFLGIQIQCANCHDHPSDRWTRQNFHELAAFFPRIRVQPKRDEQRIVSYEVSSVTTSARGNRRRNPELLLRFLDRNRDGKLTKEEAKRNQQFSNVFSALLARGDLNKDNALSLEEIKKLPAPQMNPGRGAEEHMMLDLENPGDPGEVIDPVFFLTDQFLPRGRGDSDRRESLAGWLTSVDNPWFAKAYVNRIWSELLGTGFVTPIDDMGPERSAQFPEVLNLLSQRFAESGYDVKWLFEVILRTDAYQRQVRPQEPGALPFASALPTRLRSDQLYTALNNVFGVEQPAPQFGGGYRRGRTQRDSFNDVFGFDPSTPQADLTGEIPQALFLMNSPRLNQMIEASGRSRLNQVLTKFSDDGDAISEVYLLALSREPSDKELAICHKYIAKVGDRTEAFEDLLWSLLNSSEFLSKR